MDIHPLLERSAKGHSHLCPRQVLGVRIGLAGRQALRFAELPPKRRLLIISETDGCFVDGITAATDCTAGHRSLRIVDYGKVAATFVDSRSERAVRVAPVPDVRERASRFLAAEARAYFAQLRAYQILPDEELLSVQEIVLNSSVGKILSRSGTRVNCELCGEEILNERQVIRSGFVLCQTCAGDGYYEPVHAVPPAKLPVERV